MYEKEQPGKMPKLLYVFGAPVRNHPAYALATEARGGLTICFFLKGGELNEGRSVYQLIHILDYMPQPA